MVLASSIGRDVVAGRCCQMCGRVRFGAWVLVPLPDVFLCPLQGATARCVAACALNWVLLPLQGTARCRRCCCDVSLGPGC